MLCDKEHGRVRSRHIYGDPAMIQLAKEDGRLSKLALSRSRAEFRCFVERRCRRARFACVDFNLRRCMAKIRVTGSTPASGWGISLSSSGTCHETFVRVAKYYSGFPPLSFVALLIVTSSHRWFVYPSGPNLGAVAPKLALGGLTNFTPRAARPRYLLSTLSTES